MMFMWFTQLLWADEGLVEAIQPELKRNLQQLKLADQPDPYFIGVHCVRDEHRLQRATFGALTKDEEYLRRYMMVDVRVGDYSYDNRNFIGGFSSSFQGGELPQSPTAEFVQKKLWLLSDTAYKSAVEEYSAKKANISSAQRASSETDFLTITPVQKNLSEKSKLKDFSALVRRISHYAPLGWEDFSVFVKDKVRDHVLVTTEGTQLQFTERWRILGVRAERKAKDGTPLINHRLWIMPKAQKLPLEDAIRRELSAMSDWLKSLEEATVEEDYLGPVIFEYTAASEFFRQVLPSQIVGTPPSREVTYDDTQGSIVVPTSRVGRRLFKGKWTVEDRPLQAGLMGSYLYDYEGVPAQNRTVIKDGVVRDVLMSRTPRPGHEQSTGHGRGYLHARMSAMPSNVLIKPPKHHSIKKLRKKALKLSRQVGLDYVIVIRRLVPLEVYENFEIAFSGDGPLSGLSAPMEAYRLYRDGREEPIYGVQFYGVDRRILKDIVMAGPQGKWHHTLDLPPSEMRTAIGFDAMGSSWSAPTILISEIELRGHGGGEQHVLPPPPH